MSEHQLEINANELKNYFPAVITWVKVTFPFYRKEMKGLDWGILYNSYKDKTFDSKKIENEISELMEDEDVSKKTGIYEYILSRNEIFLNLRAFNDKQKRESYEKQNKKCLNCKKEFSIEEMEGDHITPWSKGGKTDIINLQMLCKPCNKSKGNN